MAIAAALAGCKRTAEDSSRRFNAPNYVSGEIRGGGKPPEPGPLRQKAIDEQAKAEADLKAEADAAVERAKANQLWNEAIAREGRDPDGAADLFQKFATDYKDDARAPEAHWHEAQGRFRAGSWNAAERALVEYVQTDPVNPNLPEVERMLYESSRNVFRSGRGLAGVFRSTKRAYDGLNFLVEHFPAGRYADDALLALGDQYVADDDYATAALEYQDLLLRYPDSEWSFVARIRLADAYLARDQGAAYHAGYVDIDPRGRRDAQMQANRPVRSCVEAALENYQAFLDRLRDDPARQGEYAGQVAYAQGKVVECRQRLAAKHRHTAAYYARRGMASAAATYERYAQAAEAGRDRTTALPGAPSVVPAPVVVETPPPAVVAPEAPPPAPPPCPPPTPPPTGPRIRIIEPTTPPAPAK
jgi:outer membrane protein assembly factor BamD (BamD/ComL family)